MALAQQRETLRTSITTLARDIKISEIEINGDKTARERAAEKIWTACTFISDAEVEIQEIEKIPESRRDEATKIRHAELLTASQRLVTAMVFSHRRQASRFTLAIEQPTDVAKGSEIPLLVINYPHPMRRDVIYSARTPLSRFAKGAVAFTGIVEAVEAEKIIPQALIRNPNQPFR